MSTKLSLLSRTAAVAGILAIALPAFAQTGQTASPANNAPVATTTAPSKPGDKQTSGEIKTDKDKKHSATKDMTKDSEKTETKHSQPAQAPVTNKTDGAVKSDAPAATK
jgi:hypothetical protein